MRPDKNSLGQRSLQAVKWNYFGTIIRVLSQFVAQVALARLLGPDIVGSFGYAVLLAGVLGLLVDQGLGWALVHAGFVSEAESAIALTRVILVAFVCTVGTFLLADDISLLMGGDSSTAQCLRYFAPAYIFMALTVTVQARLRKNLQFKEIQISQTISYFIAYPIVGVVLAASGQGIISLVTAWMLHAAMSFGLMIRYSPQKFKLANPFCKLGFGGFGRDILAINLVNWIVDNAGAVFIGRLFGPASLGLYNTTLSIVRTPANHLVVNLQTVVFPTAAEAKSDPVLTARLYCTALAVVLFFSVPVFIFVAVAAPAIVATLLGPKWFAANGILPPIALAMIPHVVSSITGSTLSGGGHQKTELVSQSMVLALLIICYLVLPISSAVQVCWLFLSLYALRTIFLVLFAAKKLQFSYWRALEALRGPASIAMLGTALYVAFTSATNLADVARLLCGIGIFGVTGVVASALWPRFFFASDLRNFIARYRSHKGLAGALAGWLTR